MADPTIQTFCCHHVTAVTRMATHNATLGLQLVHEFNSGSYNTVCLVSAVLGIIGAVYQILPREVVTIHQKTVLSRGRQVIIWLAVADLMASIGVLVRSILWLSYEENFPGQDTSKALLFCALSSAWIQYFYTATWFWTLIYAIDLKKSLRKIPPPTMWYHVSCWVIPAILTLGGLVVLYYPDADCHSANTLMEVLLRILPNYCATYLPISIVMIVNPILYHSLSKEAVTMLSISTGQVTNRERAAAHSIKIKFILINSVFYICWAPNLLKGILLWALWFHLPINVIIILWYIMAFTNPLQAILNSFVYRRWNTGCEKIKWPVFRKYVTPQDSFEAPSTPDESTPLIQCGSRQPLNPRAQRSSVASYLASISPHSSDVESEQSNLFVLFNKIY